jgi:sec-independent protein translocase protein TatC
VGFSGFVLLPRLIHSLYDYAVGLNATPYVSVRDFISFVTTVSLVLGASFELPLVMASLSRLGLVRAESFAKKWRYAVVIIFVGAAIVSPDPSIISLFLLALPMLLLYGIGVILARVATPARHEPERASPS